MPRPTGGVHEHGCEEHHRRVEVEQRGDARIEREQRDEERAGRQPPGGEPCPNRLEETVGGGGRADEEQPGDEYERRPGLRRGVSESNSKSELTVKQTKLCRGRDTTLRAAMPLTRSLGPRHWSDAGSSVCSRGMSRL